MDFTAGSAPGLIRPAVPVVIPVGFRELPLADFVALDYAAPSNGWRRVRHDEKLDRKPTPLDFECLKIAYEVDVLGQRPDFQDLDSNRRRHARRLAHGRRLHARLGTYPWSVFGPLGRPDEHWQPWWQTDLAAIAWAYWTGADAATV
jgi:hypothetical protein